MNMHTLPQDQEFVPPAPRANWALFLDVDGTILDIAARPQDVEVPSRLLHDLSVAGKVLGGALALVSGRPIADIDRLFAPLIFAASGQHGSEWRIGPDAAVVTSQGKTAPELIRRLAERISQRYPDVVVEQKSHAIAVHYRQAPALGPEIGALLEAALAQQDDFVLMPGKCVWEIKHAGFTKGSAVDQLMLQPPFAGRIPVFVGDDRTDEDGFRAVLARNGIALPVGPPREDGLRGFTDPAATRAWLSGFEALLSNPLGGGSLLGEAAP